MTYLTAPPNEIEADLRHRIRTLALPPGAPLSRPALMQDYGVSSTPVRDALLKLQEDGLVEMRPQSGTSVSLIDLDQARQAHFLRSAAEQAVVARLAADPPPDLAAALDGIVALQAEQEDLAIFMALDARFHQQLFEAAGMPLVHAVIRRESMHIDRIRALHLPVGDKKLQIMADHRRIIDRLRERDAPGATAAMAAHLSQSITFVPQLRDRMPEYFRA